jgi:hypothetical protein
MSAPTAGSASGSDGNASETGASTDTALFSVNPDVVNGFPDVETPLRDAAVGLSDAYVALATGEIKGWNVLVIRFDGCMEWLGEGWWIVASDDNVLIVANVYTRL